MDRDAMTKPTIFFSHSSRDRAPLVALKDLFVQKTGGAIDTFLSSDGQSIPLGRNWVHRIQEALEGAKMMIVFVTPNSLRSSWLYFESGFAYAKGIRVVPVGFLGADIASISPPLSLLQGFNITSAGGLENIIALVNDEFKLSYSTSFSDEEYLAITARAEVIEPGTLNRFGVSQCIVSLSFDDSTKFTASHDEVVSRAAEIITGHGRQCAATGNALLIHGLSVQAVSEATHVADEVIPRLVTSPRVEIRFDPFNFDEMLPIAVDVLRAVRRDGVKSVPFRLWFISAVVGLTQTTSIGARLQDTNVTIGNDLHFHVAGLNFQLVDYHAEQLLSGRTSSGALVLNVTPTEDEIRADAIVELLKLLTEREIIFREGDAYSEQRM